MAAQQDELLLPAFTVVLSAAVSASSAMDDYSCRIASIGDRRDARSAGKVPNVKPIVTAEMIDVITVAGVIAAYMDAPGTRQRTRPATANADAMPTTVPRPVPTLAIATDSARN